MQWSAYPNFSEQEFACSETGECNMRKTFMDKLQALRNDYGKPMTITSGYRSPKHSIEVSKASPGVHTRGLAVDIACNGQQAYEILKLAYKHGFKGIGVSQKGSARFVHLDTWTGSPRPNMWSY